MGNKKGYSSLSSYAANVKKLSEKGRRLSVPTTKTEYVTINRAFELNVPKGKGIVKIVYPYQVSGVILAGDGPIPFTYYDDKKTADDRNVVVAKKVAETALRQALVTDDERVEANILAGICELEVCQTLEDVETVMSSVEQRNRKFLPNIDVGIKR